MRPGIGCIVNWTVGPGVSFPNQGHTRQTDSWSSLHLSGWGRLGRRQTEEESQERRAPVQHATLRPSPEGGLEQQRLRGSEHTSAWLLVPPHQPLLGRGRGWGSSEAESGTSVQKVGDLGASAKGRPQVRRANSSIK